MDAEQLRGELSAVLERSGFNASPEAKELLFLTLRAIEADPGPYRPADPTIGPDECQRKALSGLPYYLRHISRTRKLDRIGYFDLLSAAPEAIGMHLIFKYPPK
jgi:hypothetical protein